MADNKQTHPAPEGQLLLRTVAMPRDTNPNQDIFGGWIMSQMDLGGGHCVRVGNTSLQLKIEVWVKTLMNDMVTEDRQLVTEAVFTYVAIDAQGNPRPIPREDNAKLAHLSV